jgi:hypothetical protein
MDSFANYPPEVLSEIVLKMPYLDILRFCQTSSAINELCQTQYLWHALLKRDFPNLDLSYVDDYRNFYERLKLCNYDWLEQNKNTLSQYMNKYWLATNPMKTRDLRAAIQNPSLFYWPDYRIAGTIQEILGLLNAKHIDQVKIGELYRRSNGEFGSVPGWYFPTEELIRENSLNYPVHAQLIGDMTNVRRRLF